MENNNLNNVWEQCKVQDRKAQALLYNYFSKKMYAVCMRYAQTTLEAEDILQNSFVKVFTKHDMYNGVGSLEGWIKKIIVNTAIETFRKNKLHFAESLDHSEVIQIQSDLTSDHTSYKDLMQLIQQLPLGYRTVFNMYAIEGYSHKEIGQMLGISEGSSKSQLSRARQWLQTKIIHLTQ